MIKVDYTRNDLITEQGMTLLKEFYCHEGEDPQDAYARAAIAFSAGDYELAQRIYDYVSKQWFMFSSPILSNAPAEGESIKGLPISCFLTYVDDTLESLIAHDAEVAWMSVSGGGVGGHWGAVRGISNKAPGPIPFMKVIDAEMTAYKQGETRKGSYAAYMADNAPDVFEFINFKMPTGGDINRKCFNLFSAVNLTDKLMKAGLDNETHEFVDPHTNEVVATCPARTLVERICEARYRTGVPYTNFIDAARRAMPQTQKDLGLEIHGSNLCNEIHLATDNERSAVCCLSSVNLEKYDEWKDTRMVRDLIRFLDNVLQFFIDNAPPELSKAVYSATQERALGLGAMGFAGYLQSKGIPWDSVMATVHNKMMFKEIKEQALLESLFMGDQRGEAPDMKGTGRRNSHLLAIAPNANSSIICNATAGIDPMRSNAFSHRTRAGTHLIKNKYLMNTLDFYNRNGEETWDSIIANKGSVQHLDWMDQEDKDLYKTAKEQNQHQVVQHACDRQSYICQGQSVNTFWAEGCARAYVLAVHYRAWRGGLKGLYYMRTEAMEIDDKMGVQVVRDALTDSTECLGCEG